jgi:hypothetical protein
MGSQIQITFSLDNASALNFVEFELYSFGATPTFQLYREEFENTFFRSGAGKIPTQQITPTSNPGEATAQTFASYWNLDYNATNNFLVSTSLNVVTIEKIVPDGFICKRGWRNYNTNMISVTSAITNCTENQQGIVNVILSSKPLIPCESIRISIETDELAETIKLNGVEIVTGNTSNPYVTSVVRTVSSRFELIGATGSVFYPEQTLPSLYIRSLNETDIEVSVIPSVAGATVSFLIEPLGLENPILTYEYSLDGTNYQTSNIFTGQANGSYTIYVKDNFNCVTTKNYEVTDSGTRDPYLFISQANSLIFAENESVDDCNIFRNDNNSLANQSLSDVVYCAENVYKPCDTITLQFKSNYDDPKVYIRFEDGSADQLLTLTKQTLNLNKFQYLDTWYYEYAPGKLGLYFLSGDTYDETGLPNGTFNLNGNLPDFAIIGQIITIDVLGTFIIQDVAFDSTIQRKVIVIDYTYVGLPTQTRVKSIYDILPYEIYEFTIDWSVYGIGLYDILISNEDSINGTVQHLSENIAIQDVIEKHLSIRYYNKNNRDIFYKFGIENFVRIPFLRIEGITVQDEKINITDLRSNLVDSSVTNGNAFYFDAVSKKVMRQLVIALSCENVFINGVGYIKNAEINATNIPGTNLYEITAEMINTNINYTNNRQGQTGYSSDYIDFNIPGFIDLDGTGLLKT